MLNIIKRYMPLIESYRIDRYEHEGPLLRIKLQLVFVDGSVLHLKEYRFIDGSRKYAYHWTLPDGTLRVRWDNADHWPHIPTFPHHKHVGTGADVQPSTETGLESVLRYIAASLSE